MSKKTRTQDFSEEQLRSIFLYARDSAHSLENLLHQAEDADDENLFLAIADARNIMTVLTHRTASKLGLTNSSPG